MKNPKYIKPKYSIQKHNKKYPCIVHKPQQYRGKGLCFNPVAMNSIFNEHVSKDALRDGRVHCQSVRKTATFIDAYGNKVILRENRTTMNTDKNGPALVFTENNRKFGKNRH